MSFATRERTLPSSSRFSKAMGRYGDRPLSPETPETPRTSSPVAALSPFIDAVRNVKERGERDWKRFFNKFQEQSPDIRKHPLAIADSPDRDNDKDLYDLYYRRKLPEVNDHEDQYNIVTPPLDAPSPAISPSSPAGYESSPYYQRHFGRRHSPYRSPVRSTYTKVASRNDNFDIVKALELENVRLDNLQEKLEMIRQQAANLARPYPRKTTLTPGRNHTDHKRTIPWDRSSRASSVSSIHPLPESLPSSSGSPRNCEQLATASDSIHASPESRQPQLDTQHIHQSPRRFVTSELKNTPKPLPSRSTNDSTISANTISSAAIPPPPPLPPPLPSVNYVIRKKTLRTQSTPIKPREPPTENEATPVRQMRRVLNELPKTTLRRADVIQTPGGSRVRNKVWDEIHSAKGECSPIKESQSTPVSSSRKRPKRWDDDDDFWISPSESTILDKRLKQMIENSERHSNEYAVPDSPRMSRLQKTLLEELDEGEIRERQRQYVENAKRLKSSTFELEPIANEDETHRRSPTEGSGRNRYVLDDDTWMFDGKEHRVKERR